MTAVLSVRDLTVELVQQSRRLVDGISFDLMRGEILAVVGESGSGKSLTALSLMRLLPDAMAITHGSVKWFDESQQSTDLFTLTEADMTAIRGHRLAMIFQEPQTSLNPVQTIGQQIAESLAIHRKLPADVAQQRALALLDEVGIPDASQRLHWYPHQLSGGQKQRVMIAIALACEPDILLADEPTTALDVTIQKQILELLKKLCRERQLAVILITHDMGVVAEMADRVAVMRSGELIEQKSAPEFFKAPEKAYSRELLAALPDTTRFREPVTHQPLLEIKDMKVWFPQRKGFLQRIKSYTRAVDGVDLVLGRGETLALVGESGCGKTTIGKALVGLNPVSAGSVLYYPEQGDAIQLHGLDRKHFQPYRQAIQIVFQDPFSSMNPRMTVRQIIEEGMTSLGVEPDRVKRLLAVEALVERVGLLSEHLDRYPHEFSGGQRQRIAIARALAVKPRLVICDEPTSALDVSIRGQILRLLRELQDEEGLSFLFITHDLSLVPSIAHRVAVMKAGKIVEQGLTKHVMTQPQHPYTRVLLSAAPKTPHIDRSAEQ